MINKEHLKAYQNFKKYTPSYNEIETLKFNISCSLPLLKEFIQHYKLKNPTELKNKTIAFANMLLKNISETGYIDSNLYELQAIDLILKDSSFIAKKYEQLKNEPNTHVYYSAQLNRTMDQVLINAISEVNIAENMAKSLRSNIKNHDRRFV